MTLHNDRLLHALCLNHVTHIPQPLRQELVQTIRTQQQHKTLAQELHEKTEIARIAALKRQAALQRAIEVEKISAIPVSLIVRLTCEIMDVPVKLVMSRARCVQSSLPRHVAMYITRKITKRSLPQIAKAMGRSDHTTVLHGYNRIADLLDRRHPTPAEMVLREQIGKIITALDTGRLQKAA